MKDKEHYTNQYSFSIINYIKYNLFYFNYLKTVEQNYNRFYRSFTWIKGKTVYKDTKSLKKFTNKRHVLITLSDRFFLLYVFIALPVLFSLITVLWITNFEKYIKLIKYSYIIAKPSKIIYKHVCKCNVYSVTSQ